MRTAIIICLVEFFALPQSLSQSRVEVGELYPPRYLRKTCYLDRNKIDSVTRLIKGHPSSIYKVSWYINLSKLYHFCAHDSTLYFSQLAHKLAVQLNDQKSVFQSLLSTANYYGTQGTNDFEESLKYYKEAAKVAGEHNLAKELQEVFSCILNLYFYMADFPGAMKLSTAALTVAEKENDYAKIAYYNNLLGFIYLRQGNAEESRKFYQQYLENALVAHDSVMVIDAITGLSEVFLFENKPEAAIPGLHKAYDFYTRKLKTGNLLKKDRIPYTQFALAKAYRDLGSYETALQFCLHGFKQAQYMEFNLYDVANYFIIIGEIFENLGRLDEAVASFHQSLTISTRIKHAENIRDVFQALSRVYARQKRYDSAFQYGQMFGLMKDSIVNVNTRREVERIKSEYDISKKNQEIIQQRELHKAEMARKNLATVGVVIFFSLLVIITMLIYNRYRLKERAAFQKELNAKQNELFNILTTSQDKERKRIAQDIHDQVGSVLSAAKLQLSALEEVGEHLTVDQRKKYSTAMALIDQVADELRDISHNLMPATLSRLGLVAALRGLIDNISECTHSTINLSVHGFENRMDESIEIHLYPIVLELLSNVIKHSGATTATVQLIRYPCHVHISVEDNGRGFNSGKEGFIEKGIGLRSLLSRVEYLKGTMHIDSQSEKGTMVMIDIPVSS